MTIQGNRNDHFGAIVCSQFGEESSSIVGGFPREQILRCVYRMFVRRTSLPG
jgi:hypothetical protein